MKRKRIWVVVSVLVVLGLLVGGFGCKAPAPEVTPTPTPTPTAETMEDILARAASITSFKYDMVMTFPGQPTITSKTWVKGENVRSEATAEGQTGVIILNRDKGVAYIYFPAQNIAQKFELPPEALGEGAAVPALGLLQVSPAQWAGMMAGKGATAVGSETVEGKECLVIEATLEGQTTKVWVWKKYGLPIRLEASTPQGSMILEYKNLEVVNIPDDMFELPSGVQIQEQ